MSKRSLSDIAAGVVAVFIGLLSLAFLVFLLATFVVGIYKAVWL